jgi:tetratricopeptide (TPR) repeat protein
MIKYRLYRKKEELMQPISFDEKNFERYIKEDKSSLLLHLDFLLKTKKMPIQDVYFCLNGFLKHKLINEAILFLRRSIESYPQDLALKKVFFKLLYQFRFDQEALLVASELIKNAEDFEILYMYAHILERKGELQNALKAYQRAYKINQNNSSIYKALSRIYKKIGRLDLSLKSLEEGVKVFPKDIDLLLFFGNEHFQIRNFESAKKIYEKIIQIDEKFVSAYVNLGVVYKETLDFEKAKEQYLKALELDPNNSGAYNNLGVLYKSKKEFLKAFQALKKAISFNDKNVDAYANMGVVLKETNKPSWSLRYFEQALRLQSVHVNANVDYGIALMLLGDYKKGLIHYQYRIKMREFLPKLVDLDLRLFYKKGMSCAQKRILVFAEQGFGDAIQFVRYLHVLKAKGAYVIFRVRKELKRLFDANSVADLVICEGDKVAYDFHIPLLSIPYLFDIDPMSYSIQTPYLQVTHTQKEEGKKRKIAFAFSGSVTHKGHLQRFIEPSYFSFLAKREDIELYSLQKGEDKELLKKCDFYENIIDKTDELKDFLDTASFVSSMDLVITSDTSIVHLCGALGVKTWLCVPSNPDWRWGREGEKTFWYASVTLFRQSKKGNWDEVFEKIEKKLS